LNALALDSATETLVVALGAGDRLYTRTARQGLRHAQTIVPQVEQLLAQASLGPRDLDLVVAGTGPGSFTGLRIALATARGLARGASCPVVGVCTLDAMAWPLQAWPGLVVPLLDARKGRVYTALYRSGVRVCGLLDATLEELAGLLEGERDVVLTGPHSPTAAQHPSLARCAVDAGHPGPDASGLLELGMAAHGRGEGGDAVPVYLRRSEAEHTTSEQRKA
jgi:tRNA threonylcarbamoyladenosine biosynthesis protein TsaB